MKRVAIGLIVGACTGCGAGYHVSAGPYFTTKADVGIQVRAGLSWGLQVGDHSALVESLEAGVGPAFTSAEGSGIVLGGIEYIHLGDPVALRTGIRAGFQSHFGAEEPRSTIGGGLTLALWDGRDREHSYGGKSGIGSVSSSGFGGQLDAFVMAVDAFETDEDRTGELMGYFSVMATWQSFTMIDLF